MRRSKTISESTPHKAVADQVRDEMVRQGLTQQDVADRLLWTQQSVSRRISGKVPFNVAELAKIAELLGVPIAQFTDAAERVA